MKNVCYSLLIMCGLLLHFASCKKNQKPKPTVTSTSDTVSTDPPTAPTYTYANKTNLNKLFAPIRSTPQSFSVTAGASHKVTGSKGTVLSFYPNSFKDANGNIITSGTINIQLIEMYKPGQMIANRATTTANGQLLKSGGQVYISATKAGAPVYANKYGIAYPQPAASSVPMQLFYGNTQNADSVVTWAMADTTKPGAVANGTVNTSGMGMGGAGSVLLTDLSVHIDKIIDTIADSTGGTGGGSGGGSGGSGGGTGGGTGGGGSASNRYIFDTSTKFGWVNCDDFNKASGPLTIVNATITDSVSKINNTQVFLVLPTINSVMLLDQYNNTTRTYSTWSIGSGFVPEGMTAHLIIMAREKDEYYYYKQTGITITKNMLLTATLEKKPLSYIISELGSL